MSTQQPIVKRPGKCNGNGHAPDCTCGYGGVYYGRSTPPDAIAGSIPPAGTRAVWEHTDFRRPSSCPKCQQPVFFVRHNGGSVWFDALGQPWPKHPCMATEPDMAWVQTGFPDDIDPGNRMVFGVIHEARVSDPGISAFFVIACSDGTIIQDEFVFSLNPCEAVGGLVKLELTPDNSVGARRFKAIDDMLAAHKARLAAEERAKKSLEKRRDTLATKDPWSSPGSVSLPHNCEQGTIKLRMVLDIGGIGGEIHEAFENLDYSGLHLHSTKVTLEITPKHGEGRTLKTTLAATEAEKVIGGTKPCTETYEQIYNAICVRKGLQPPN